MVHAGVQITRRPLDSGAVYVVDGLFPPDIVAMLDQAFAMLAFTRSEYSTENDKTYLSLNHNFSPEGFTRNPVMRMFHQRIVAQTMKLFPGREWRLDRVHCNAQSYGDMQYAHPDLTGGLTALYYVNSDWQDHWHGETLFHGRSGEPEVAVALKPGRTVIFEADVIHRGGLPSRICMEQRLSVAFKFRPPRPA
jgi:SM-20-related protein